MEVAAARGVRFTKGSAGGLIVLAGIGGTVTGVGTRLLILDNLIKKPRIARPLLRIRVRKRANGIFPGVTALRALRAIRCRP